MFVRALGRKDEPSREPLAPGHKPKGKGPAMSKRALVVLLLVSLGSVAAAARWRPPMRPTPPPNLAVVERAAELREDVEALARLFSELDGNVKVVLEVNRRLERMGRDLDALEEDVLRLSHPKVVVVAPPRPVVVPEPELDRVLGAVSRESFGNDKLRVVQTALAGKPVSVEQVKRVLRAFSFSSEQLAVLRLLAPNVVDRHNAFQLYEVFNFESEKSEVQGLFRS